MRRNIFLYLALACFLGIIAIFAFDGYLGMYDNVYVTSGEFERKIGPEYWQRQPRGYSYPYQVRTEWGEPVFFRYEIDNRRFVTYPATVEASLWKSNEKIADLFSEDITLAQFDKAEMEWTLSDQELEVTQYTVKISRGEVELGQGIILDFYTPEETENEVPTPPTPVQ